MIHVGLCQCTVLETSGDGALYGCLCLHWYKSAGAMRPLMTKHNVQSDSMQIVLIQKL